MNKRKDSRGFTLVEIAIVLVIIGLLLGGILKGQELINNAKVRSIADRQNSLKVAWFAFIDRYAALPGDYLQAHLYVAGAKSGDGDGLVTIKESALAFQHLSASGYIRCAQCTAVDVNDDTIPTGDNSPNNTYGGVMSIWNDSTYYVYVGATAGIASSRLIVHTGPRIPSNIIGEVDRKIDNGIANTGDLRLNTYDPTEATGLLGPLVIECMSDVSAAGTAAISHTVATIWFTKALQWRSPNLSPPVISNCGAGVFI